MKIKKIEPFLDEVTVHGELFKGPKEVFICPECGSEHVKMGEIAEFGLPNEGIFEVEETRRECVCEDCGCEFNQIYGRNRALSDTSKGVFLIIMGVTLIIAALVSIIFWFEMIPGDVNGNTAVDEIIVGVAWPICAVVVISFGFALIDCGGCDL